MRITNLYTTVVWCLLFDTTGILQALHIPNIRTVHTTNHPGCRTVFDLYKDDILAQTIGQVIARPNASSDNQELSPAIRQALENVRIRAVDSAQVSAVEQLQRMLKKAAANGDARLGMGWPAVIEGALWSQIKTRDPIAILIFAHYALLLRHYDHHCWWMINWSDRVM